MYFCKIVRGEIPADIVFKDDDCVVFRDINPVAPIHLLVVPTHHVVSHRMWAPQMARGWVEWWH